MQTWRHGEMETWTLWHRNKIVGNSDVLRKMVIRCTLSLSIHSILLVSVHTRHSSCLCPYTPFFLSLSMHSILLVSVHTRHSSCLCPYTPFFLSLSIHAILLVSVRVRSFFTPSSDPPLYCLYVYLPVPIPVSNLSLHISS
jgi:hypothetical protein